MKPADDPPGFYCHGCRRLVDANEDAFERNEKTWCSDRCWRLGRLGEAEQLPIGGR